MTLSAIPAPLMLATSGWTIVGTLGSLVAAATGLYLVYALRRTHAHCALGVARWNTISDDVVQIEIPVHVVPGGAAWVLDKFTHTIKCDGRSLDLFVRRGLPQQNTNQYENVLIFDIRNPHAAVVVDVRVKFKHGGRAKLHQTVTPPP